MRVRIKSFGVLVSALLVTCLLSWPQEAKKGPDKPAATNPEIHATDLLFPPGFDDLFDKIYYESRGTTSKPPRATAAPATGELTKKSSALSLRLYGGFSRLAAGDLNEGLDGYFELLELYEAMVAGSVTSGGYSPLHAGYNFGADLVFQLSPMIGVGIGAGYLQSSKSSLMTFSMISIDGGAFTLTGTQKISAMPIRLAVFFTLPLSGKLSLTADAGGTYYAALKLDAGQRLEFTADDWQEMSLSASRSSLTDNLGFQGSLGFEYKISHKMGFFIEAVGRYARFKNFDRATWTSEDSGGVPETDEGKIYLETNTDTDLGSWSWFIVSAVPPISNAYNTYREPKIDLSGFSLQAGIRIRL
ncbi:MAG: hypothetical protein IMZ54_07555 [Acidobacteria bacterium]|nr:hypothetical protein [Acidobacteriota bacterium]MBE3130557.1 hypothetical protein [Acidobacteriota bacterium]